MLSAITEKEAFNLCEKYYALSQCERNVFNYLIHKDCFEGTQTELTTDMGYPAKDNANVRKALLSLEDKGYVYIEYKDPSIFTPTGRIKKDKRHSVRMKRCWVVDGWWMNQKGGE